MSFQEISQILAIAWISASHEDFILIAYKNLSISPPSQEDIQVSFDSSCQFVEEIKQACNNFDGEKPIEYKIEECRF